MEVVIEANIDTPNCASEMSFDFDKETFMYYVAPYIILLNFIKLFLDNRGSYTTNIALSAIGIGVEDMRNILFLGITLICLYGKFSYASSLDGHADHVIPYKMSEFIGEAFNKQNRDIKIYKDKIGDVPYKIKKYDYFLKESVENISFTESDNIEIISLIYNIDKNIGISEY